MASTRFGLAPITFEDQLSGAFENYQDVISEKVRRFPFVRPFNLSGKRESLTRGI
jgi:hypothetical protein